MPKKNQRIVVFGASKGVGRHVVEQALEAGYAVTAVARNPESLGLNHPQLRVVMGSVMDSKVVHHALEGVDFVICTLGAGALSSSRVRSEGTRFILAEMKKRGLKRIMALSLLGALETRKDLPFFLRYLLFPIYLRKPVAEHERQERLLQESQLDWTVVRPPFLTDEKRTETYAHGFGRDLTTLTLKVSRADTAHFFLSELESSRYSRQAVGISDLKATASTRIER